MKLTYFTLTAALLGATFTVSAQQPAPETNKQIQERKVRQQKRIGAGAANGTLKPGQTQHLEKQEHAINREERSMRAQDNGKLTKQDRKTIDAQQNQESKRIARDKQQ